MRHGMNPARYGRQQGFPAPSASRFAMDDAVWKQQRGITALSAKLASLKRAASA
jgi:hypothetical protein